MKKNITIIILIFLNIILTPLISFPLLIRCIDSLVEPEIFGNDGFTFIFVIILLFYLRLLSLPIGFQFTKKQNNYIKNLIKKLSDSTNCPLKLLLFAYISDIFVYILLLLYFNSKNVFENMSFIDHLSVSHFGIFFSGYGLFFAYLSLIVWVRLVSQKFKTINAFNLLLLIIIIIMSIPFLILTIWIFVVVLTSIFKV